MSDYPYGKNYQRKLIALAKDNGCKRMEIGVLSYLCAFEFDWVTGDTGDVPHKDLATLFGCDYKTIQKAVTALQESGIIRTKRKGVKWSDGSGKANRYAFAVPSFVESTPAQKTGRGMPKKRESPPPKSGQHYINPYIHKKGASAQKETASRGQASGEPMTPERQAELMRFSKNVTKFGYARAKQIENELQEAG